MRYCQGWQAALPLAQGHMAGLVGDQRDALALDTVPRISFVQDQRRRCHEGIGQPTRRAQQGQLAGRQTEAVAGRQREVASLAGEQLQG